VLDGEVVALRAGHLDFGALTSNPRERPGAGVTIYFVAFDLLADSTTDLRSKRYRQRRTRLERLK
jgi:ATP-dependent DNA ligase